MLHCRLGLDIIEVDLFTIDIILVDIQMRNMDGVKVAERIRLNGKMRSSSLSPTLASTPRRSIR